MTHRELLREYAKAYLAYMDINAAPASALHELVLELETRIVGRMRSFDEAIAYDTRTRKEMEDDFKNNFDPTKYKNP